MIHGKERLAVIACAGHAVLEEAEHDLVGMRPGGIAHFAEQRGIHADVVVLHGRAGDVHGGRIEVVHHRIAVLFDIFEGAVAGPFAEFGELANPAVRIARRAARHTGGQPVPLGRRGRKRILKFTLEAHTQGRHKGTRHYCH